MPVRGGGERSGLQLLQWGRGEVSWPVGCSSWELLQQAGDVEGGRAGSYRGADWRRRGLGAAVLAVGRKCSLAGREAAAQRFPDAVDIVNPKHPYSTLLFQ